MDTSDKTMANDLSAVRWIHGSEDCRQSTDPPLQVDRFDDDTFILRQSKCLAFEAPFLYLLIGEERALLLDTGAIASQQVSPVRATVQALLRQRQQERGRSTPLPLLIAHSHGHGDHRAGDSQFTGQPDVHPIPPGLSGVRAFFNIPDWPKGRGSIALGGRGIIILPLPGHTEDHIAVYDQRTGILLTGDTLYPGLLVVNDQQAYRASAARRAQFTAENPVQLVLGGHIEMKQSPSGELFPIGTTFQPDEHPLPLRPENLMEWIVAVDDLDLTGGRQRVAGDHFVIEGR